MSEEENGAGGGAGGVIEQLVTLLKYKVVGEKEFDKYEKKSKALTSGKKNQRLDVKVSVNTAEIDAAIRKLKDLRSRAGSVMVNVKAQVEKAVGAPAAPGKKRQHNPAANPADVAERTFPITRGRKPGELAPMQYPEHSPRLPGAATLTIDQFKDLRTSAQVAAAALRAAAEAATKSALSSTVGRGSFDSFSRHSRGMRSRLDLSQLDSNIDAAHAAGKFSSLKFSPSAPDMSSMKFSKVMASGMQGMKVKITPWVPRSDERNVYRDILAISRKAQDIGGKAKVKIRAFVDAQGLEMGQMRSMRAKAEKGFGDRLSGGVAALGVGAAFGYFAKLADDAQALQDQIRSLTKTEQDAAKAQDGLFAVAKSTRSDFKGTVELFSSLQVVQDKTKLSVQQTLDVIKSIQTASRIGGGTAAGQKRAIVQLEQAFGAGKMDGQALNSIEQQARGITKALAEGMGKSVGDLKALNKAGKLTAEEMAKAFLKVGPSLQAQLQKIRPTLGTIKNYAKTMQMEWAMRLSTMWDGWGGGMAIMQDSLERFDGFLTTFWDGFVLNMGSAANASKALQLAVVSLGGAAVTSAIIRFGAMIWSALAPVLAIAAGIFAAFLAIDDVVGWVAGKQSMLGELVGPYQKWKGMLDEIGESFKGLWKQVTEFFSVKDNLDKSLNDAPKDPPLVGLFKNILSLIRDTIDAIGTLVGLLNDLQNGDYSNIGKKLWGGIKAVGTELGNEITSAPIFTTTGGGILGGLGATGPASPQSSQTQQLEGAKSSHIMQSYGGDSHTENTINITANSNRPQDIADTVADSLRKVNGGATRLAPPTSERKPN